MALLGTFFTKRIDPRTPFSVVRFNYNTFAKMMQYKKCCKILGVSEDSDQEEIRQAYLKLVKKYHPDSGTPEANADKFSEIDKAFKVLINRKSLERWDVNEDTIQEQDIKHTAPQHRQYLSYDGMGIGTPFQRQKQYTKIRATHAAENVLRHRISKAAAEEGALLVKTSPLKHKIKTKYGLERLVEDLIQESMSRGEFSNLAGSGKPLPDHQSRNPYVDFVTHKLNEVLIDNGFTPEWITLQKEIREEIQVLKSGLLAERSYLGAYPLSPDESDTWRNIVAKYEKTSEQINKRIDKFNLVVPILNKQMIRVDLQKEAEKVLTKGQHSQGYKKRSDEQVSEKAATDTVNVFSFFEEILFKK